MVGNWTGVERLEQGKWRPRIKDLCLTDILQGEPNLVAVRRGCDVWAKRARLEDVSDDLMVGDSDRHCLGIERGADIAILSVGGEDLHARTVRDDDPCLFLISCRIEHLDVVLSANRDPDFPSVRREESLVRRAPDIDRALDDVGLRIDEGHRIRADRHDGKRPVVRREAHAVNKNLSPVERAEIARLRIAKTDDAEQPVVRRVDDRHGVRELLGGVYAVVVADRDLRSRSRRRRLSG